MDSGLWTPRPSARRRTSARWETWATLGKARLTGRKQFWRLSKPAEPSLQANLET